jgi:DNA-binding PadR family transcriptional regulator
VARPSQTDLAVLAALSIEPMTGYALRETITSELGSFWSESFGQIYPALARLRAAGLIEADPGTRGNSSVHRLTDAGRESLIDLLRQPITATPPRNGLLLRIFFGHALGPAACSELVEDARRRSADLLAELAVARRAAETEPATNAHRAYWLMTISAGEHAARASIAWAQETLAALGSISQ